MLKMENSYKKQQMYLVPEPDNGNFKLFDTLREAQDYGKNVWWEKFPVYQVEIVQKFKFVKVYNNGESN